MGPSTIGNLQSLSNPETSKNQLMSGPGPSRLTSHIMDETNSIEIANTEYIGDILPTSSSFQTQYFLSINPGLPATFPWLANIAQFYEEYEFSQLIFTFKSMVTDGNISLSLSSHVTQLHHHAHTQQC